MAGCDGCELWNPRADVRQCYAGNLVDRYFSRPGWPPSFAIPAVFPERLKAALRWPDLTGKDRPNKPWLNGYPRLIFWCDLGDPFTESLPVDWLAPFLPELADSPHIHIWVTKRPRRMRRFFEAHTVPKNFWLLTTVTSQTNVARIAELRKIEGASVLGVSLEPLLGPVSMRPHLEGLDWVILGFESGHAARPGHPDWARGVRDDCRAAGVPFFYKQWGEWVPRTRGLSDDQPMIRLTVNGRNGQDLANAADGGDVWMQRVGKKAAGRVLDGEIWSQLPPIPSLKIGHSQRTTKTLLH